MSQSKDSNRQQLRKKQQEAVDLIATGITGKLLYILPGGYGKTKAALASYAKARSMGTVNRLLIVAPSREQRTAWMNCDKDLAALGIDALSYIYDLPCGRKAKSYTSDVSSAWAIKRHQQNQCEIFVVTVQSLLSGNSFVVNQLMSKCNWMVIAEECHHLARESRWGDVVERLRYEILIGLSASPDRSKGAHLFTETSKIESRTVFCSHKQALEEGAIRPLIVIKATYQVEFVNQSTKETHVFKLSELAEYLAEHNLNLSEFEAKQNLRVLDQFVRPLFLKALDKLEKLNDVDPGQHQMIVHAPSVLTAKAYCNWINLLVDTSTGLAARWVGSGAEQNDEQNDEIIADFKANKFPILVQVQMFGEGSDNVRASVGLWLSLIGSYNPSCYQAMVRHIRRNPNIEASKDFAYLFIPEDSPGLAQAEAIQNENDYCVDSESLSDSEESESRQLTLPTLEELEKQIKATAAHLLDVESPETLQRKIDQVKSDLLSPEYIQSYANKFNKSFDETKAHVFEFCEKHIEQVVRNSVNKENLLISEKQSHDIWMQRVEQAVKRIARHLAQQHHPVAVEKSTFNLYVGQMKKKINGILKNKVGNGKSRETLEIADLKIQYEYLYNLLQDINKTPKSIPLEFNI